MKVVRYKENPLTQLTDSYWRDKSGYIYIGNGKRFIPIYCSYNELIGQPETCIIEIITKEDNIKILLEKTDLH